MQHWSIVPTRFEEPEDNTWQYHEHTISANSIYGLPEGTTFWETWGEHQARIGAWQAEKERSTFDPGPPVGLSPFDPDEPSFGDSPLTQGTDPTEGDIQTSAQVELSDPQGFFPWVYPGSGPDPYPVGVPAIGPLAGAALGGGLALLALLVLGQKS